MTDTTTDTTDTRNPPHTPRANRPNPALQSTPQARGSATVSERIGNVSVLLSNIRPWIFRDVENFAECSIDEMLKVFLVDCSDAVAPHLLDKTCLFKECLESVLPICNGEFRAKGLKAESSAVKDHLAAYSAKHNVDEKELYPDFVKAVNTALLCLRSLSVPGVRSNGSSPVCFHVNDPSLLRQSHQGKVSQRKPDLVLVSKSDARQAHGSEGNIYYSEDLLFEVATKPPNTCFKWRGVRTFVEFKVSKRGMAAPPHLYTFQPYAEPPKHKYLVADVTSDDLGPVQSDTHSAVPASCGANSRLHPSEPARRSAHQQEKAADTGSDGRKRTSKQLEAAQPQPKRQKSGSRTSHPVIVQAGSYAAEMFAAHGGRQHVIGLIIVDDLLYLWRYDRQGAIQCSAFNFVQDLPRFLVLLFAMQRFDNRNWGLNPDIDPNFGSCPQSHRTILHDEQGRETDIILELSSEERVTHFGLNGRATNVFPATSMTRSYEDGLVAKVFWAEESRKSEPDILKKVYEIATRNEDVKGHVPDMLFYRAFWHTSTAAIRGHLGMNADGARVLYVIVFRRLKPITTLVGDDFLHTWWAAVKCHLALWKNGVYHRDISPSNLMFYLNANGKIMGVLNDFDLASTEDGPTGTERTGTVPFMATALLEDAGLKGEIKHSYEHDAESFIWVLVWITLQYENGKLRTTAGPLDEWLTANATTCCLNKNHFLISSGRRNLEGGVGHEQNFEVATECINILGAKSLSIASSKGLLPVLDVDTAFQKLLSDPVAPFLISKT